VHPRDIIEAIESRAKELEADYHDDTVGSGTSAIRQLCDLFEETIKSAGLREKLRRIDRGLRKKMREITYRPQDNS
jgi:hypothetical protein